MSCLLQSWTRPVCKHSSDVTKASRIHTQSASIRCLASGNASYHKSVPGLVLPLTASNTTCCLSAQSKPKKQKRYAYNEIQTHQAANRHEQTEKQVQCWLLSSVNKTNKRPTISLTLVSSFSIHDAEQHVVTPGMQEQVPELSCLKHINVQPSSVT